MSRFIAVVLCFISVQASALGGYDSLSQEQKNVLSSIVKQLGISDTHNAVKKKIYDASAFAFDGKWNSYWFGLNDLSSSKYQDGRENGFIEVAINHQEEGTLFLTYYYRKDVNQIIAMTKQVRYGSQSVLMDEFDKRKANTEKYAVKHESSNYALLQKKGKVSFDFFHVGASNGTGSIVYQDQFFIDL